MKISKAQLDMVLSKIGYEMLGYGSNSKDLTLDLTISEEDPGTGAMVECLTIEAIKPTTEHDDGETRMKVEIYPEHEKQEPRASKINSFKITKNY
jgi:hypothetical protein